MIALVTTMRRIGLLQELPRAQKRQLRADRFEREANQTGAEKQLNAANIERDTAIAWIERYYTEQMRDLVLRQIQEAELQVQTTQSGYGVGRQQPSRCLRRADSPRDAGGPPDMSQFDKQGKNASWMLARWVGPEANRPIAAAPPAWETSRLDDGPLEEHIEYHPDLIMMNAQVEAAQTEARLAEANKKADWSVEAMYSQRGSAYSNMISIGVSVLRYRCNGTRRTARTVKSPPSSRWSRRSPSADSKISAVARVSILQGCIALLIGN